ncbi:MAG: diphthine synthase [Candidatus Thermoplasmatota archaeon]|jgi:diphthine synthase|nr:diphthine synthase [Candidatus Thermoplasmatota archaeon]MCL5794371.1 diphthine synthase [Candidatus Thermoplasmatota archaeon]
MLVLIGLGLDGLNSITRGALEFMETADRIYLDSYTSIIQEGLAREIAEATGKDVSIAERELLENHSGIIVMARDSRLCILVSGDPLSATTHFELIHEARISGIEVKVFPNASIALYGPLYLGLFLYRMGPPVSIPFTTEKFFPISVYRRIYRNFSNDLHTLLLLDLKDGRNMSIGEAVSILTRMEEVEKKGIFTSSRIICAISKMGTKHEKAVCTEFSEISGVKLDDPVSLVLPSHPSEQEERFMSPFRRDRA